MCDPRFAGYLLKDTSNRGFSFASSPPPPRSAAGGENVVGRVNFPVCSKATYPASNFSRVLLLNILSNLLSTDRKEIRSGKCAIAASIAYSRSSVRRTTSPSPSASRMLGTADKGCL